MHDRYKLCLEPDSHITGNVLNSGVMELQVVNGEFMITPRCSTWRQALYKALNRHPLSK